jgi:hypothetical protein
MPMSAPDDDHDVDPLAEAYQSIGEYFVEFSKVEHELGQAVIVVLGLQKNEASDAIVSSLDFAKKAGFVLAAINDAKNASGSEASEEWKKGAATAVKEAFECNDDRVSLSHSLLQPNEDGSVDLKRLSLDRGKVKDAEDRWVYEDFTEKIMRSRAVAGKLRSLNKELRNIKIEVPAAHLSLSSTSPMLIFRRQMSPALMQSLVEPPASPKED